MWYNTFLGGQEVAGLCIIDVRFDPGKNASLSGDRKAQGMATRISLLLSSFLHLVANQRRISYTDTYLLRSKHYNVRA